MPLALVDKLVSPIGGATDVALPLVENEWSISDVPLPLVEQLLFLSFQSKYPLVGSLLRGLSVETLAKAVSKGARAPRWRSDSKANQNIETRLLAPARILARAPC